MKEWLVLAVVTLSIVIFVYYIFVVISHWIIIVNAFFKLKTSMKVVNANVDLESESLGGISVLIPAFNESDTILDSIKSLLLMDYKDYEIIVVNDGSEDDTLTKLISHFDLKTLPIHYNRQLNSERIRGVYTDLKHPGKLIVIDKENGGKADSLNAAINYSRYGYICCIDADCILEPQAIKKIVRIFARREETIAVGGMVKVVNGCEVKNGKVTGIGLPETFIEQVQVIEYLRAFLSSRFTWNKNNGNLIISGAFGMFDKEAVIAVGGYREGLGEDMELIVRLQEHYLRNKIPYSISLASDAVCWTQVPDRYKDLQTQRVRWHKGLIDSLITHKKMLLNPKYGIVGMISFPFQFFVEMIGPLVESVGYVLILILLCFFDMTYVAVLLLLMAYLYGVSQTVFSVIFEHLTYNIYKTKTNSLRLFAVCFAEPLFYRPITVWWRLKACLSFRSKGKWGEVKRKGF